MEINLTRPGRVRGNTCEHVGRASHDRIERSQTAARTAWSTGVAPHPSSSRPGGAAKLNSFPSTALHVAFLAPEHGSDFLETFILPRIYLAQLFSRTRYFATDAILLALRARHCIVQWEYVHIAHTHCTSAYNNMGSKSPTNLRPAVRPLPHRTLHCRSAFHARSSAARDLNQSRPT